MTWATYRTAGAQQLGEDQEQAFSPHTHSLLARARQGPSELHVVHLSQFGAAALDPPETLGIGVWNSIHRTQGHPLSGQLKHMMVRVKYQ